MKPFKIYFQDNSEWAEEDSVNRGFRGDVFTELDDDFFQLSFYDLARLQDDYNLELKEYGTFTPEPNLIIVQEVSTKKIIETVESLVKNKYFNNIKKLDQSEVQNKELIQVYEKVIKKTYESVAKTFTNKLFRYDSFDEFKLKDIKNGILFLFATWSPTIIFFQLLIDQLIQIGGNNVNIYIFDIDDIPENFYEQELKSRSHGKGETFWVKDGEIIGKLLNYGEGYEDKVKMFTKKIIDG